MSLSNPATHRAESFNPNPTVTQQNSVGQTRTQQVEKTWCSYNSICFIIIGRQIQFLPYINKTWSCTLTLVSIFLHMDCSARNRDVKLLTQPEPNQFLKNDVWILLSRQGSVRTFRVRIVMLSSTYNCITLMLMLSYSAVITLLEVSSVQDMNGLSSHFKTMVHLKQRKTNRPKNRPLNTSLEHSAQFCPKELSLSFLLLIPN